MSCPKEETNKPHTLWRTHTFCPISGVFHIFPQQHYDFQEIGPESTVVQVLRRATLNSENSTLKCISSLLLCRVRPLKTSSVISAVTPDLSS